jgi:ABC-type phosphate transport system ATPase subunit
MASASDRPAATPSRMIVRSRSDVDFKSLASLRDAAMISSVRRTRSADTLSKAGEQRVFIARTDACMSSTLIVDAACAITGAQRSKARLYLLL